MSNKTLAFMKNTGEILEMVSKGVPHVEISEKFNIDQRIIGHCIRHYNKSQSFVVVHQCKKYICEDFVSKGSLECDGNCPLDDCVGVQIATESSIRRLPNILSTDSDD